MHQVRALINTVTDRSSIACMVNSSFPGARGNTQYAALSGDPVKSRSHEIGNLKCRVALKFGRHLEVAALLSSHLTNFKAIGQFEAQICRLWDFLRACDTTCYLILNGPLITRICACGIHHCCLRHMCVCIYCRIMPFLSPKCVKMNQLINKSIRFIYLLYMPLVVATSVTESLSWESIIVSIS